MRIVVIGAGALGSSLGGRLAKAGQDVTLVSARQAHVDAINLDGLKVDGVPEPIHVRPKAYLPERVTPPFDLALITGDANSTPDAAQTAARVLRPQGFAVTLQNGIGNIEALAAELGHERVIGGSTLSSFRGIAPGHVEQTHVGLTTIGELDGTESVRVTGVMALFEAAGYPTAISTDIVAVIWGKLVVNSAINPLCAVTGLRLGEIGRFEPMNHFQDAVIDEIFALVRAKGLKLNEDDLRASIKDQCWSKFSKPSMLQHIEAGRRTEIDALNGALLREAEALGIPMPYNMALVALVKGRELHEQRRVNQPDLDYVNLERLAKAKRASDAQARE